MKKEPFRSLLVTSIIYILFFGILILIELEVKIFPSRHTDPIEIAFQLSGNSDEPTSEVPKELVVKPPSNSGQQSIITTSDPSDFNAVLVNKVDTTLKNDDTLSGNAGASNLGNNSVYDSASGIFGNGVGQGYIYDISMVSEMPSFLGGGVEKFRKWVVFNITSGDYAIKSTDKGTLLITFIIDENGNIGNIVVKKGVSEELDKEVVKIFASSPRWEPAKQQEHPVKILYTMPIHFAN
jgi:TonB family protein